MRLDTIYTTMILALCMVMGNVLVLHGQPFELGNQLNDHANWDTGVPDWNKGNSGDYIEGDVVPHIVVIEADSTGPFFLDICLDGIVSGIYGYVGLAAYDTDYAPTGDFPDGDAIVIDDTEGAVDATNADVTSLSGGVLNNGECDGTGEIGWRAVFSITNTDSTTYLYFGGVLGKPGDTGADGGTVADSTSPSNKNGNWQSRVESGGDKTTQIASPDAALPVEIASFDAMTVGSDVVLTWVTASETNNAGFAVEHGAGAAEFQEIAFVPGVGTSLERLSYTHTVADLTPGKHRFRLKQVDFDGAFEYSEVVEATIEVPGTHALSEVYPNPFNPSTAFELVVARDQIVTIDVFDMLGRHVESLFDGSLSADVARTFTVNASGWTSGTYTVVIKGEAFTDTRSLVLLK